MLNALIMTFLFRAMREDDWPAVAAIYIEGIQTGHATFQNEAPAWEEWDAAHIDSCRIITETDGQVSGWAALSPTSKRPVYVGVAEVSVYVGAAWRGQGVGSQLLKQLVMESEASGFWTLQAGIFPENVGSLRIHQAQGFREVGRREKIGQMHGVWRDTLLLERRSKVGF